MVQRIRTKTRSTNQFAVPNLSHTICCHFANSMIATSRYLSTSYLVPPVELIVGPHINAIVIYALAL